MKSWESQIPPSEYTYTNNTHLINRNRSIPNKILKNPKVYKFLKGDNFVFKI